MTLNHGLRFILPLLVTGAVVACGTGSDGTTQDRLEDESASGGPRGPACVATPEVCDGLDNDCDGIADNDLPGCDVCAPHHELPVVTHFSKAANAPTPMAADQADIEVPDDSAKPYVPGTCYPRYAGDRYPTVDRYIGDVWSTTAISDDEATGQFRNLCQATGIPFRFLKPDALDGKRMVSKPGAVQVLHAVSIAGSLATIVLPASWSSTAPKGGYPILANGYYDLNANAFHEEGPEMFRMIAESSKAGRTGAIGILWNGGGGLASRTLNPRSQDQFAAVIDFVASKLGGDAQRIIMYGTSRGAATALTMASNPKHHPYRVTFASAAVPPTRIGEHSTLQSATFGGLLDGVAWSTGLQDAWRTGWKYPACAGHPELTGKSGPEAHLYILTGATDPTVADEHMSLISPEYIAGLKAAGTMVHLEAGTHDNIVPYAHQVEYGLKLLEAGIPLEAEVMVRSGHYRQHVAQRAWDALQAYVDPSRTDRSPSVTPGIAFFRVNRGSASLEPFTPTDGAYPFTLEGPRVVARGNRFPLMLVGAAGTNWEVSLNAPGIPASTWTGTIPPTQKSIQWVTVPVDQPLADYTYKLRIQKPGKDWAEIPASNTIDGSVGVVTLVATEPNLSGTQALKAVTGGQVAGFASTTWGLSEY